MGIKIATNLLYLDHLHTETRESSGELAAKNLINTLDRIEKVDVLKIPKKLTAKKWLYKKEILNTPDGQDELEISIVNYGDQKGWLFSKETVEKISLYYGAVKNKKVVSGVKELKDWKAPIKKLMPNWMGSRFFILLNVNGLDYFLSFSLV